MRLLRVVVVAAWLLLVATAVLGAVVAVTGPVAVGPAVGLGAATATLGLWIDGVSVALLVLVSVVGATVASYARRYLDGERHADGFGRALALVSTGMALVVTAASLPVLLVGWVLAGQGLVLALGHRRDPAARAAARRTRSVLMAGDALLVLAVVVLVVTGVSLDRADLAATAATLDAGQVALLAVLVLAAGLVRSAQVPLHRWLPETSAAPTPVSALLHAGLVNGAGLLGVLLWPLLVGAPWVLAAAAVVGAVTVVVAGLQSRARSDVKGRLATSTSAQMGWMTVQIGSGVPAAALVHVIGHGLYKQSLFLESGSAVQPYLAHRDAPAAQAASSAARLGWGMVAVLVSGTVAALALASGLLPWHGPGTVLVAVGAVVTTAVLMLRALTSDAALGGSRRAGLAALPVAALVVYLGVVGLVDRATRSVLVPVDWPTVGALSLGWLVVVLVLLVVLAGALVDAAVRAGRLARVRAWGRRSALPPRSARALVRSTVEVPDDAPVSPGERAATRARAATAAALFPPTWSLDSFVATNPLGGLVDLPRNDAFARMGELRGTRAHAPLWFYRRIVEHQPVADDDVASAVSTVGMRHGVVLTVDAARAALAAATDDEPSGPPEDARTTLLDDETVTFLSWWTDRGEAAWAGVGGHQSAEGLWPAWRATLGAGADRALGVRGLSARVLALPARADEALAVLCGRLGIAAEEQSDAFARSLARVPGWVSHLAELSENTGQDRVLDLLAVRLALHDALRPPPPAGHRPAADETMWAEVWQEALAASRRRPLVAHVATAPSTHRGGRASADLVFCIDVRSEPLRRRLESRGDYRTFGFAGFFGVPLAFAHLEAPGSSAQCPVLLQPRNTVEEHAAGAARDLLLAKRRRVACAASSWHGAESGSVSPFALAEGSGPVLGARAAVRSALPGVGTVRELRPEGLSPGEQDLVLGFSVEEQAFLAEASLLAMGLVGDFAPLVVLVGHGSTVTNNPFAAGYDCGACGGNGGAVNARTLAAVLASPDVRARLAERGIVLPDDTVVIGGLHDTTRDVVTLFPPPAGAAAPDPAVLDRLVADLAAASRDLSAGRARTLPGAEKVVDEGEAAHRHVRARALDWAQVRPEWALVGNHAFVVGPRELTRDADLQGRVFLHSYRHEVDPDGAALEVILTAPLVVAQWINSQYLATTTDPDGYGSGSKTVHNVVGRHGVVAGVRGDLRPALPRQAVLSDDRTPRHEPLPLLAVVHAPLERVDTIVARHTLLQQLCGNDWVTLVVVDPQDGATRRYESPGRWVPALAQTAGPVLAGTGSAVGLVA